jgi:hypothetical protein
MPDKRAYLYHTSFTVADFTDIIGQFQASGVSLQNPGNGLITEVSEEGEQFPLSRELLLSRIQARNTINFQWWLTDSTDLFSRIRFLERATVEEYTLNGLGEDIGRISDMLLSRFKRKFEERIAVGFVIDTLGVTEDYYWDDFFLNDAKFDMDFPSKLGMPLNKMAQIVTDTSDLDREVLGSGVILSTK